MSGGNIEGRGSVFSGQQDSKTQEQIIEDLENKIADAQRLAAVGEARLNKWRKRAFF